MAEHSGHGHGERKHMTQVSGRSQAELRRHTAKIEQDLAAAARDAVDRLDLLEVCTPLSSELGQAVEEKGGSVHRCGLYNECDMTRTKGRDKVLEVIATRRPRLAWFSPVCSPFCALQNANERTPEQRRRLQKKRVAARRMLINCLVCMQAVIAHGGHVVGEQPTSCGSWRDAWEPLLTHLHVIKLHGCAWGLRAPGSGLHLFKPWTLVTTRLDLAEALERRCPGNHRHQQIEGSALSQYSAGYPRAFCRRVAELLMRGQTWSCWVDRLDHCGESATIDAAAANKTKKATIKTRITGREGNRWDEARKVAGRQADPRDLDPTIGTGMPEDHRRPTTRTPLTWSIAPHTRS